MDIYILISAALTIVADLMERAEKEGHLNEGEKADLRRKAEFIFARFENAAPPPPPEAGP